MRKHMVEKYTIKSEDLLDTLKDVDLKRLGTKLIYLSRFISCHEDRGRLFFPISFFADGKDIIVNFDSRDNTVSVEVCNGDKVKIKRGIPIKGDGVEKGQAVGNKVSLSLLETAGVVYLGHVTDPNGYHDNAVRDLKTGNDERFSATCKNGEITVTWLDRDVPFGQAVVRFSVPSTYFSRTLCRPVDADNELFC